MENGKLDPELEGLIVELYERNAVKFGSYRLKSGVESPIYVDLRVVVSFPELLKKVGNALHKKMKDNLQTDPELLCGVPYAALPFATCISTAHNLPMIMRRKEVKAHGTKRAVEGEFTPNSNCLIVEDVVSTGGSILETAEVLRAEGLVVNCALVLLDRLQGGKKNLKGQGIELLSVISIMDMLMILEGKNKISPEDAQKARHYIETSNPPIRIPKRELKFEQRVQNTSNKVRQELFDIMTEKETNLAFSADVNSSSKLLEIVDQVGEYICLLKTHVDILPDFTTETAKQLSEMAKKHNFMIMEDRKFADIGSTCIKQFTNPRYLLTTGWAQLVTAHALPGPGIITALKEASAPIAMGCVLVVEMSSADNLAVADYVQSAVTLAENNDDFVVGIVCQRKLSDRMIHMTPGVNLSPKGDTQGQTFKSPEKVIKDQLSDIIIVGRGIYNDENPKEKAMEYKKKAWDAYKNSFQ